MAVKWLLALTARDTESAAKRSGLPTRYFVAILGAFGLLSVIGTRKCFALVMTHITATAGFEVAEDLLFTNCTVYNTTSDLNLPMGGDIMFLLHSAYYAGQPILNIPGAVLATKFSPVFVIACGVMASSIITIILPYVIKTSVPVLFFMRLLQGATDGIQQPCTTGLLCAWTTDVDKTCLFTIYFTGSYLAPALASVLSGVTICYIDWCSILIAYGTFGVLWSLFWALTVYDTPNAHPRLSSAQAELHRKHSPVIQQRPSHIPWRHILTSPSVWAVFVGFFCHSSVYCMLVVEQPQYFFDSFNINIADIGLLTTLPHLGLSVSCLVSGMLSDRLLSLGLNLTFTRKLLFSVGKLTEGSCFIGLFFASDWRIAIALITVGATVGGLAEAGYHPIPADIAPQYASVIAGFASMGSIGAIINTVTTAFICGRRKRH